MMRRFVLTAQPLDEVAVAQSVEQPGVGAIVTFVGRVRDASDGHAVVRLEYEAYPEMVEATFEDIGNQARRQFAIADIAIHHRTGVLEVGEASVVVAVAAVHRGPAFDACRFAIDRLKRIAPIWKKEITPEGAVWVEDRP